MDEPSEQPATRQILFAILVLIAFGVSVVEIAGEVAAGESLAEMADDILRVAVSTALLIMVVADYRRQQRRLGDLRRHLSRAQGQLAQIDHRSPALASQYRAVMQKQFDAWRLTGSEQDIVIDMLKGLSFREIAALRDTREKTVRQQASSVYRKAGVSSRHELAAWFFEDMLDDPPPR